MQFGDFVKDKRQNRKITLKDMAKKLDLSIAYLRDIENNRRNPIKSKIEVITHLLDLSTYEQELLNDLAGMARNEVSPDLLSYIMSSEVSPYVRNALRQARRHNATIEDWKRITKEFKARK